MGGAVVAASRAGYTASPGEMICVSGTNALYGRAARCEMRNKGYGATALLAQQGARAAGGFGVRIVPDDTLPRLVRRRALAQHRVRLPDLQPCVGCRRGVRRRIDGLPVFDQRLPVVALLEVRLADPELRARDEPV